MVEARKSQRQAHGQHGNEHQNPRHDVKQRQDSQDDAAGANQRVADRRECQQSKERVVLPRASMP